MATLDDAMAFIGFLGIVLVLVAFFGWRIELQECDPNCVDCRDWRTAKDLEKADDYVLCEVHGFPKAICRRYHKG